MEGKTVILGALIVSLVLAQFQVDAKSCCPSTAARNIYNACRLTGASRPVCANLSGCIIQTSSTCKPPNTHDILENSGDVMKSYCKMGCASSACNVNAYGEVGNEALEKCIDACSEFCNKGSIRALEIEIA